MHLLNDAVNNTDYIASNDYMIGYNELQKDVEGCRNVLISDNNRNLPRGPAENHEKLNLG